MKTIKKILSMVLRVGTSIALLFFLFKQVDEKILFGVIKDANKALLLLSFCVSFFMYLLCFFRWVMLLKAASIKLPLSRVAISFAGGIFFNLFLPSTIGGDLMRSIDLAAHTKKAKEVVATVFLDRLSGYIGLVILSVFALVFGWNLIEIPGVFWSMFAIVGLLVVVLLVLFNKFIYTRLNNFLGKTGAPLGRIRGAMRKLHQEIYFFRSQKKVIFKNVLISVLVQAITPLSFYLISLALGLKIKIIYFFIFLPIIGAITLLPLSIGGLGLRDASTVFFFGKIGIAKDLSFAMSLISFSFILLYSVIGGIIYVLTIHHRRIQPVQSSATLGPH